MKRNCTRATECGKEAWSVNCEPMNKNRMEGDPEQGEQAIICKAPWTKAKWRKSGGCAMKQCEPLPGEISPRGVHPQDPGTALLQAALTRENLQSALKRVRANKAGAAVDGLDINPTIEHLKSAWPDLKQQLLAGTYRPSPVRGVVIAKADAGQRELGIPTVTDRLIQPSTATSAATATRYPLQ